MKIQVDDGAGYSYHIDSLDPDLLAKWLLEIFDRIKPDHVIPAMVRVWPSWVDGKSADFIVDSRILGRVYQVRTPREAVKRMMEMIDEAEKLH